MTWTVEDVDDSGPGELGESFFLSRSAIGATSSARRECRWWRSRSSPRLMFLTFSIFAPHFFTAVEYLHDGPGKQLYLYCCGRPHLLIHCR